MNHARTHWSAVFAACALATTVGLTGCTSSSKAVSSPSAAGPSLAPVTTVAPSTPVPSTPAAPTTPSPSTTAPTPTHAPTPATTAVLKAGSSGPAVRQLQQRLSALGYWLGTPDGRFGGATQQAVFALQKAAGLSRSGTVNAATRAALAAGTRPTAKSTSGRMIEVDLKRDLLLFVTDGRVTTIINTSTGGGYVYFDQGSRNVATTPKGHFTTYRVIDGQHRSSLGFMFRPRYFTGGFAIHGDSSVPAHPVSHGCVRVSDAAIDWIWATNADPIGTHVWIY